MPTKDRATFNKLILQVERDLMQRTHLRTLLTAANTTVVARRRQLRTVKARLKRRLRRRSR